MYLQRSDPEAEVVLLATENVDRGASDARNILCYIMDKKDDLFQLGSKVCIIDRYAFYLTILFYLII